MFVFQIPTVFHTITEPWIRGQVEVQYQMSAIQMLVLYSNGGSNTGPVSKGGSNSTGPTFRLLFGQHTIQQLDRSTRSEYWVSLVFRSPLYKIKTVILRVLK